MSNLSDACPSKSVPLFSSLFADERDCVIMAEIMVLYHRLFQASQTIRLDLPPANSFPNNESWQIIIFFRLPWSLNRKQQCHMNRTTDTMLRPISVRAVCSLDLKKSQLISRSVWLELRRQSNSWWNTSKRWPSNFCTIGKLSR